ncbi:MAG: 50S ribosomal protein L9 [Gammaproteobacteria bacterium TMED78]|nr:MAG: 50S ribosomal protein L9 [Gammaproteobacteria bacterium TMED78]
MDIILLEKIENLGNIGDKVSVKSGFARNYLIPKGKATVANEQNLLDFEHQRVGLEEKAAKLLKIAEDRASIIKDTTLIIKANIGAEGKLFGSVGTPDIIEFCNSIDFKVTKSEIRMPNGPIKTAGEHQIDFYFHADVSISVKVIIEASNDPQSVDFNPLDISDSDSSSEDIDEN